LAWSPGCQNRKHGTGNLIFIIGTSSEENFISFNQLGNVHVSEMFQIKVHVNVIATLHYGRGIKKPASFK
jgi:hypothetical protein